jgi:hypothetical protein
VTEDMIGTQIIVCKLSDKKGWKEMDISYITITFFHHQTHTMIWQNETLLLLESITATGATKPATNKQPKQ